MRLFRCESALEVAVQQGHLEVVKRLVNETNNALYCREYGGRTPILTAAKYGRTDIFNYLLTKGANVSDRCLGQQVLLHECVSNFDGRDETNYVLEMCPSGASVSHLAAMYGNEKEMDTLTIDLLNSRDSDDATPMHYAMCHYRKDIIIFLLKQNVDLSAKTKNGSTILHSAAACDQSLLIHVLEDRVRFHDLLMEVDKKNRTFAHYLFLKNEYKYLSVLDHRNHVNDKANFLFHFMNKSKYFEDFLDKPDIYGRLVWHYAAISGHYVLFSHFLVYHYSRSFPFLHVKDTYGHSPIDLLFRSMKNNSQLDKVSHCSLDEIFKMSCRVDHSIILSPHEMSFWKIVLALNAHGDILKLGNFEKYLKIIILKKSIYSLLIFHTYMKASFQRTLLKMETWIAKNVLEREGVHVILDIVIHANFTACNKSLDESIFHKIMLNANNTYWTHSPAYSDFVQLHLPRLVKDVDRCFDKEGFNLLHRAVMGGHVAAVDFLLDYFNASANVLTKDGLTIFQLLLKNAQASLPTGDYVKHDISRIDGIRYDSYIFGSTSQLKDFNQVGYILLRDTKFEINLLPFCDICVEGEQKLSLIHFLSAKKLNSIIEHLVAKFGNKILKCKNIHGFTPSYFANISNNFQLVRYISDRGGELTQPDRKAEYLLFMKVFSVWYDKFTNDHLRLACDANSHKKLKTLCIKTIRHFRKYIMSSDTGPRGSPKNILNDILNNLIRLKSILDENNNLQELKFLFMQNLFQIQRLLLSQTVFHKVLTDPRSWRNFCCDRFFNTETSFSDDVKRQATCESKHPEYSYLYSLHPDDINLIPVDLQGNNANLETVLENDPIQIRKEQKMLFSIVNKTLLNIAENVEKYRFYIDSGDFALPELNKSPKGP